MKRIPSILLFIPLLFTFSACRTLGTWKGREPEPQKSIYDHQWKELEETGFKALRIEYKKTVYDLILLDPQMIELKMRLNTGQLRGLDKELQMLRESEKEPLFILNGGIFMENGFPLGYHVTEGKLIRDINRGDGWGNFYLKPNGIFSLNKEGRVSIIELSRYVRDSKTLEQTELALQSGPLLLNRGEIHEAFNEGSSNKFVRNGVGTLFQEGKTYVVFAISDSPVNFYDFTLFFSEFLSCTDALYLDGHISRLYLPALNRFQRGGQLGPLISGFYKN